MDIDIIPLDIITLLLYIPIIVTIINIARYIIGFKTIGFYPTIALSFAFILTGGRIGLIITAIIILCSYLTYKILYKVRLHYTAKLSVNYILVSLVLLGLIYGTVKYEIFTDIINFNNTNLGGMLLIIIACDSIVKQFIQKDTFSNIRSFFETLVLALIGWGILRIPNITEIIIANAWIIPILIVANLIIGQTTILRLMEYNKFRFILKSKKKED